jgi:NADP-dependent 3-hydroxy acid dehydrogenase YdfG
MKVVLKPVGEQVMVIVMSSDLGAATAREAAARGARVALASASASAVGRAVRDIRSAGGRAIAVAGGIADETAATRLAEETIAEFGRIDTWINEGTGHVCGSDAAVRHLRRSGGALINVTNDSQVKTFNKALRTSVEREGAPMIVTLVDRSSADPQAVLRATCTTC